MRLSHLFVVMLGAVAVAGSAFAFTMPDYFPYDALVTYDRDAMAITPGTFHVAAAGLGPDDGFTGYNAFQYFRPRWGDYGAAVTDGSDIWIASEYIGQTCTFAQYTAGVSATSLGAFGSCGGTRTSLANWGTRLSKLTP